MKVKNKPSKSGKEPKKEKVVIAEPKQDQDGADEPPKPEISESPVITREESEEILPEQVSQAEE